MTSDNPHRKSLVQVLVQLSLFLSLSSFFRPLHSTAPRFAACGSGESQTLHGTGIFANLGVASGVNDGECKYMPVPWSVWLMGTNTRSGSHPTHRRETRSLPGKQDVTGTAVRLRCTDRT